MAALSTVEKVMAWYLPRREVTVEAPVADAEPRIPQLRARGGPEPSCSDLADLAKSCDTVAQGRLCHVRCQLTNSLLPLLIKGHRWKIHSAGRARDVVLPLSASHMVASTTCRVGERDGFMVRAYSNDLCITAAVEIVSFQTGS